MAVAFDKSNSALGLFSDKANPRQDISKYQQKNNKDFYAELEKMSQFSMTMMFKEVQNQDPFNEDGNKAADMMATVKGLTDIQVMKLQCEKFDEMAEAVKNPGCSAAEIQGYEVEYDDGERVFDGRSPVEFGYKLEYEDKFNDGRINTVIKVRDKDGKVVFTGPGSKDKGENSFTWDGRSTDGKLMPIGAYRLDVSAKGSKNGMNFKVTTSTTKTDVVKSVQLENGLATKVQLESGRYIEKNQIKKINGKKEEIVPDMMADVDMIGKNVSLNFSKTTIENGNATINYYNKVKNHEDVKISIFDEKGRKVKQISYDKKLKEGEGTLRLDKELEGLNDGKYTVSITVKDIDENKRVELDKYFSTRVVGVNMKNNSIHDTEGKVYSTNLIEDIAGDYQSPFERSKAYWIGKEIKFEDNEIVYSNQEVKIDHEIPKSEAEELLFQTNLWVYNDKDELVKIVKHDMNPMDIASTDGGVNSGVFKLDGLARSEFGPKFNNVVDPIQKKQLYEMAFKELLSNPNAYIKEEYRTASSTPHQYKWDGSFDPDKVIGGNDKASGGHTYRFKLEHVFINPQGHFTAGDKATSEDKVTSVGVVTELHKDEHDKVAVTLEDGRVIAEERVIFASGDNMEESSPEKREEEEIKRIKKIVDALTQNND